jgi:uncharacterized circularly permuted ATP-grasp superfamily protein
MILPNVKPTFATKNKTVNILKIFIILLLNNDASGGYGMLIGPKSTKKEQQEFIAKNKTTLEIISHNQ